MVTAGSDDRPDDTDRASWNGCIVEGAWLGPGSLVARRAACAGPLAPLVRSLARDLDPLLDADLELPPVKARLSRSGGRCPRDGATLRFDPMSPRIHRCPACHRSYDDESHYRWWVMGYHLWLAERAVHAATLHALLGHQRYGELAREILERYSDSYLSYPNADNVLGPSRPFFSTYLESLWLLHLCVALDLLETVSPRARYGERLRERVVAPSSALIGSYDEGASNRQVWNNAALLAAATCLGGRDGVGQVVWGSSGVRAHLSGGLLTDGTWFEGENYHQFAHRGLWYCLRLAEAVDEGPLPAGLVARFDAGFRAPFESALPDFTAPARRDSRYAAPLRQWRFAEMAELGLARMPGDATLRAALRRLYDGGAPQGGSGRARSTGEAERDEPAVALDRASLGWKSALFALPELPALQEEVPRSVLQPAQGLAIFRRRRGTTYVSLDYGESGGGHGHPDRLNVTYIDGAERWLDDPGTGSYVDPSLHWYRSTLAHCAPLVDGRSQRRASGQLVAWDERGLVGLVEAVVDGVAEGVRLYRTLVVLDDYFVDELRWEARRSVLVELPLQSDVNLDGVDRWIAGDVDVEGAGHLRDVGHARWGDTPGTGQGARRVGVVPPPAGDSWRLVRRDPPVGSPVAWLAASAPVAWWRAIAPGAPGRQPGWLHVVGVRGRNGWIRTVWSGRSDVRTATCTDDTLTVVLADGARHSHRRHASGWRVEMLSGGGRSTVDLGGPRGAGHTAANVLPASGEVSATPPTPSPTTPPVSLALPVVLELGEAHYRRSELGWREAGSPRARITLSATGGELRVNVRMLTALPRFAPPDASNDMDNERAEVNFDSVQLHLLLPGSAPGGGDVSTAAWLLAPLTDGTLRRVPLDAAAEALPLVAEWRMTGDGYSIDMHLPRRSLCGGQGEAGRVWIDVLVNETTPDRERRRGQLVMSGSEGEFVYLRGDRHDPSRCLPFLLPDD